MTGHEKTVIDADLCGRMIGFCQGMDLSENAQAMDAIRGVGPGSNFLGCEHTQENFRAVTLEAATADCSSYEQWMAEGGLDAAQKANAAWKRMLESYEDPGLDPGVWTRRCGSMSPGEPKNGRRWKRRAAAGAGAEGRMTWPANGVRVRRHGWKRNEA